MPAQYHDHMKNPIARQTEPVRVTNYNTSLQSGKKERRDLKAHLDRLPTFTSNLQHLFQPPTFPSHNIYHIWPTPGLDWTGPKLTGYANSTSGSYACLAEACPMLPPPPLPLFLTYEEAAAFVVNVVTNTFQTDRKT